MADPRQIAYQALLAYDRNGTFPRETLERQYAKQALPPQDRALAAAITYTTLERMLTLDHHLRPLLKQPVRRLDPPVRVLLRMGACQLLLLDRIPPHAAIHETVQLAARHCARAKGFVNGVLRSLERLEKPLPLPEGQDAAALSVRHSVAPELAELLLDQYGTPLTVEMLRGMDVPAPLHLLVNTLRSTERQVAQQTGAQSTATPGVLELPGGEVTALPGFEEGHFLVMGRSAAFAVQVAAPRPGETVLDLCAAPGGKSFAAAIAMGDEGRVLAFDLTEAKIERLREGVRRLGLRCVETAVGDATAHSPALDGLGDLVLCDLPCSGLGIAGKQPEIRYKRPDTFAGLPALQLSILRQARHYVKPGGRLLYSTCTLNREENEQVVARFLTECPEFSVRDSAALADRQQLRHLAKGGCVTLLPAEGQDGFFVALLERKEEPK